MKKVYFSKAQIRAALALHEEDMEFGDGLLKIRELSGTKRIEAEERAVKAGTTDEPNNAIFRAKVFQLSVVDPDTKQPLFDDSDVEWLAESSFNGVLNVAVRAMTMNGIGAAELKSGGDSDHGSESSTPDGTSVSGSGSEAQPVTSA